MKKYIKKIAFVIVVLFALIGIGGTIAFASGEITWGGTKSYNDTLEIFEQLKGGIINQQEAKQEVDNLLTDANNTIEKHKETIKEHENTIEDNKNTIKGHIETIELRDHTIEGLETDLSNSVSKDVIGQQVNAVIKDINNNFNGPQKKYTEIQRLVNDYGGDFGVTEKLGHHGQSDEDKQLEQAIKDMKHIQKEAEKLQEVLDGTTE